MSDRVTRSKNKKEESKQKPKMKKRVRITLPESSSSSSSSASGLTLPREFSADEAFQERESLRIQLETCKSRVHYLEQKIAEQNTEHYKQLLQLQQTVECQLAENKQATLRLTTTVKVTETETARLCVYWQEKAIQWKNHSDRSDIMYKSLIADLRSELDCLYECLPDEHKARFEKRTSTSASALPVQGSSGQDQGSSSF